jgi:DedD protein
VAKPAEKVAEKPADKPADKPAATAAAPATADDGRFVVQIGAFAEVESAREARMKVERMGLKTYTQVIESSSGRRIRVRVGPYPNKAEAEKAANKIKSGGLQAAILLL